MSRKALLTLTVLPDRYAICRLDANAPVPAWAGNGPFMSITRTTEELSIVCLEGNIPAEAKCMAGWRVLKCEGPLDFNLIGVMASIAEPLADAAVAIFPIATHDTDYVLVKELQLEVAVNALTTYGHIVRV
ncbi:MAG TPA: ACT domain-containing protein [Terriglobia bacterium]|nr:ACT domain-containing protein [Terriglobia bacterium]